MSADIGLRASSSSTATWRTGSGRLQSGSSSRAIFARSDRAEDPAHHDGPALKCEQVPDATCIAELVVHASGQQARADERPTEAGDQPEPALPAKPRPCENAGASHPEPNDDLGYRLNGESAGRGSRV